MLVTILVPFVTILLIFFTLLFLAGIATACFWPTILAVATDDLDADSTSSVTTLFDSDSEFAQNDLIRPRSERWAPSLLCVQRNRV